MAIDRLKKENMPTYDYHCEECGDFEHFQSITSAKLKKCPECGAKVTRKLGTGGGILFKGSGFYETDYRSESYKQGAKAAKEASKQASKPDSSSTTKKPSESKTKSTSSSNKKASKPS